MISERAGVHEQSAALTQAVAATPVEPLHPAISSLPDKPVVANDAHGSLVGLSPREVWSYRELLYFLTWRDIKVRYKQTVMGASWAIIQPLVMMFIFAIFFGLLGVPTDNMPFFIFFYCGLLPWTFFSNAISHSSLSLVASSNLITKVYFPRVVIPAAIVGAGLVDLLIASVILLLLAVYYRMPLTANLLMLPLLVVLITSLSLGLGMWLAALTVKYRDVRHVLPFVLQVWFFITPIVYPQSVVPEQWRWLLAINPMTGIVEGLRTVVTGRAFDWTSLLISAGITAAVFVCAVYSFKRIEKSFADLI